MPTLSPPTLTEGEQKAILSATAVNPRDHLLLLGPRHRPAPRRNRRAQRRRHLLPGRTAPDPCQGPCRDRQGRPPGRRVPAGRARGQAPEVLGLEGAPGRAATARGP